MKLNTKSGFTLLEIIIVIIIVGVLASLALPRFFKTIEYSRAQEALNNLSVIRQAMERCALRANTYVGCDTFTALDITDPTTSPGTHFTYSWPVAAGVGTFTVLATRNGVDGGAAADTVSINETGVKVGTGNYQNIK